MEGNINALEPEQNGWQVADDTFNALSWMKIIAFWLRSYNGAAVEVWEWISIFISHFIMDLITYPCWD